jgi:hypothetical protein
VATTLTVQDGINFATPILKNQRLQVQNNQPALGIAQIVVNRMLAAPLAWRFNRANLNFGVSTGAGTDYAQTVPSLGWIENQWLTDGAGNIYELKGAVYLSKVSTSRRPVKVCPVYDDNQGHITFRFNSIPDQSYTANFDYQQKAPLILATGYPWATVPDEFAHCFLIGFLSLSSLLVNDSRFPIWEKQFLGSVLSQQDGLDSQARAIFMGGWLEDQRTMQRSQGDTQGGITGRST